MNKEVYFVRHAESESNVDGLHRGTGAVLTEQGRNQAEVIAGRVEKIGVDALISSTYVRAKDTADAISKRLNLPLEESDLFAERRSPSAVMGRNRTEPEVKQIFDTIFDGFASETYRHSDEENFEDLRARAIAGLELLENHPASRICVVTHGLFLRVLFCAALHGPSFSGVELQRAFEGLETSNTGIFYLRFYPSHWSSEEKHRWQIVSWNDSVHLG